MMSAAELTVFTKIDGPLTKSISITPDGSIISDGSACVMSRGTAQRAKIPDVTQLAELIKGMGSNQALGLGALRADLPDQVHVVRKAKINGATSPDIIARTADNILYRPSEPAFALLDLDTKGMPQDIAAEISRRGGFFETLISVMPNLALPPASHARPPAPDCFVPTRVTKFQDLAVSTSTCWCRMALTSKGS
jgi:hypothetical protein